MINRLPPTTRHYTFSGAAIVYQGLISARHAPYSNIMADKKILSGDPISIPDACVADGRCE